jgi:hypothetical protein
MRGLVLNEAQLEGTELNHIHGSDMAAKKANFKNTSWDFSSLDSVDFEGSDFEGTSLFRIIARNVNFVACNLKNANFEGANLDGVDFSDADLTKANLKYTSLKRVNFESAKLDKTDFRFSRGISKQHHPGLRAKDIIKRVRARLSGQWASAAALVFSLVLGIVSFFYFSDTNHLSIGSLQKKFNYAWSNLQYEKALQISLTLIERFKESDNKGSQFNSSLRAAALYRSLDKREKSIELLENMLGDYKNDKKRTAVGKLELALLYKETRNLKKANALLEEVEPSEFEKEFGYSMKLADAFRQTKQDDKAINIYKRIIQEHRVGQKRLNKVMRNLSEVYEEIEKRRSQKEPGSEKAKTTKTQGKTLG